MGVGNREDGSHTHRSGQRRWRWWWLFFGEPKIDYKLMLERDRRGPPPPATTSHRGRGRGPLAGEPKTTISYFKNKENMFYIGRCFLVNSNPPDYLRSSRVALKCSYPDQTLGSQKNQ